MRIAQSVFAGSIAVLTVIAAPVLANGPRPNSHADANAKAAEEEPASGCHAYQKGPDGSWIEIACHEGVETAAPPVRAKSASHHPAGEITAR